MASDPPFAGNLAGSLSPADLRQALQGMLMQRLAENPSLAAVAPLLLSRFAPAPNAGESAAPKETPGEREADVVQPSPTAMRLSEAVAAASAEDRRLRGLLAELGAALGACPACLGSDATCVTCSGLGRPGFGEPNEQAFTKWVRPAAARCSYNLDTSGEASQVSGQPNAPTGREGT